MGPPLREPRPQRGLVDTGMPMPPDASEQQARDLAPAPRDAALALLRGGLEIVVPIFRRKTRQRALADLGACKPAVRTRLRKAAAPSVVSSTATASSRSSASGALSSDNAPVAAAR
jgi:hypothetical protein